MRNKFVFILFAATTIALAPVAPLRAEMLLSSDPLAAQLDAYLTAQVAGGFSGTAFVVSRSQVLLSKGYGLADPQSGRPMTPDTGFDIGSLVKPFTAAATLKLETQGKLSTSDPISKYLPQMQGQKSAITVAQLLDHTSGLPDIINREGRPVRYTTDFDYEPVSKDEIIRRAVLCKLDHAPGARANYSNLGYSLLAAIVEQASGMSYEEYVRKNLLDPAGMSRTGYVSPHWTKDALAVGITGGSPWGTPLDHPWLSDGPSWNLRGNGGMISTAEDLGKWIKALQGNAVLDQTAKAKLFQLLVHVNARGTRTMGPAGSNTVFDGAYLWYLDEDRLIIVLTSNDRMLAEDVIPKLAAMMRDVQNKQ
jgi:CubicO group peptidase (beta-lactamase class C family)